jgi:AcrR family transcriptional regulator
MPRPRFARLPPAKRHRILEVAAGEFADHGFTGASLNHIIDQAGISKGAAYYYFDDKADLYLAVVRHGWEALTPDEPLEVTVLDRRTFWPVLARAYGDMVERARAQPWLTAVGKLIYGRPPSPEIAHLVADEFARVRTWLGRLVAHGQAIGAVRADVPSELLLVVLMGALEAADRWVVDHPQALATSGDDELSPALFHMLRRLVEPPENGR